VSDSEHPDLDPEDWPTFRANAHRMLDDIIDYVAGIRSSPVWRPMPDRVRQSFAEPLPRGGQIVGDVHAQFKESVMPYATGNVHPGFMAWVHGAGNVYGMMAELLAAGLNSNLGGRDHAAIQVERQIIRWFSDLYGLPQTASGLLVTGTSIANFMAVVIARAAAMGTNVRRTGVGDHRLVAYTSSAAHSCVSRAMDMAGLGTQALQILPVDAHHRIPVDTLRDAIARDASAGYRPFLVIGTAGTVDIGAFDDLAALAGVCRQQGVWFHVDGAFGALGALSPRLRPSLAGIEQADSIAFDFHKWGQVPYDAGCLLVRDEQTALRAFATEAAYLRREERGLAAGRPWPCDLGPDLSRGFRALKVWYTFKVLGADRMAAAIEHTCALARRLAERVDREPELERVAPAPLNIVCFRYRFADHLDRENAALAADVQESGIAAPSTTTIAGCLAIRSAIVNHRTRASDVDALVDAVLTLGRRRNAALRPHPPDLA
jgi:glutamate/tyrosine decarboxylase-like PLP-dependent enzyme